MFKTRVAVALLALAVMSQQPHAQQPQDPNAPVRADQTPTFRGGINFVRVDAIVTDKKGQPVTDLKQSDFEVLEDNKPQAIEQFRLVKIDGIAKPGEPAPHAIRDRDDEEREAARDDVRVVVIFLDDYHVRLANSVSIRDPLTRFIQTQLRPNDMIAVMYPLTPVQDVEFTRNFNSVLTAINNFQGVKYDYRPRNQFEENYSRYPAQQVEEIRNQVVMGALRGLSVRLGSMREGRKSVIFVSEGFTALLPAAMQRQDSQSPDAPCFFAGQQNCNPAIGDPDFDEKNPRTDTANWFEQSDLYSRMKDVFTAANRNNVSMYSLDPRRLAIGEYGIDENIGQGQDRRALQMSQDTLRVLSEQTDGRAIVNRNQVDGALAQVIKDESVYYLFGYNTQAATDGKFHEIKVRVKRPGVEVHARKGYWAATTEDLARAAKPAVETAKPVQEALASIAPIVNSARYIRTWVGTERGPNGKTRVTLLWEPLPPTPGAPASARREPPGAVSVLAADEKGDLIFRGRSPDAALASNGSAPRPNDTGASGRLPAPTAATTPQKLVFDAPPGKLELRMTVQGAGGVGTLDTDTRTIDVPDLTKPQAELSTPRVFRTRNAREFQAIAGDANAMPTVARDFSRTERLLIRFDVYGQGTERPDTTAVLLNRNGQKVADLMVAPATAGGTHQIDLGLNTLATGEYLVQITAKGASGQAQELVPLRVGG